MSLGKVLAIGAGLVVGAILLRGKTSALPPPPGPVPPLVPTLPLNLAQPIGMAAEVPGTIAFLVNAINGSFIHVEDTQGGHDYHHATTMAGPAIYLAMASPDTFYIAYGGGAYPQGQGGGTDILHVDKYTLSNGVLTKEYTLNFGDRFTKVVDFKRLASGALLLAWSHINPTPPYLTAYFSYCDVNGIWQQPVAVNAWPEGDTFPNNSRATNGNASIAEHPEDGKIWVFWSVWDGNQIDVIKLVEKNGYVSHDSTIKLWSLQGPGHPYASWGEGSMPVAFTIGRDMLVNYNLDDYHLYDPEYRHCANVIVRANVDGTISPVWDSKTSLPAPYVMVSPYFMPAVGVTDTGFWVAFTPAIPGDWTTDSNQLTLFANDGATVIPIGIPFRNRRFILGSSRFLIANMDDGSLHLFPV